MKIAIKTMGCRANRYETDKLFEELSKNHDIFEVNEGVKTFDQADAMDFLIVNTCTITHLADTKSRQAIRSFKNQNPKLKVIVFGCGSNVAPEDYKKISEVDFVMRDRNEICEFFKSKAYKFCSLAYNSLDEDGKKTLDFLSNFKEPQIPPSKISEKRNSKTAGLRTRALLKIQDGCDNFCAYCIVPFARGKPVSYPSAEIIKEAQQYEEQGYKEIVITGINIGLWQEKGRDFTDLLYMLLENTSSVRFRISSIEPNHYPDNFYKLFLNPRICPHLHMSLQSGCDTVLERMRRKYKTADYKEICENLRKVAPLIGLTTDVIVGFPGETDEEFQKTYDFVEAIGFLKLHVFPYSIRKNTLAEKMKGQIEYSIKQNRAGRLRELSDKMGSEFKEKCLGKEFEVLVESRLKDKYFGYTSNYIPVQFSYSESCMECGACCGEGSSVCGCDSDGGSGGSKGDGMGGCFCDGGDSKSSILNRNVKVMLEKIEGSAIEAKFLEFF